MPPEGSPRWPFPNTLYLGLVSALLSGATFGIGGPYHEGAIFGLALAICLKALGLKGGASFLRIVGSAMAAWFVAIAALVAVAIFTGIEPDKPIATNATALTYLSLAIAGGLAGSVGAIFLSICTQWVCDGTAEYHAIARTGLLGALAGLIMDVKAGLLLSSKELGQSPWFTFFVWQPSVLLGLVYGLRGRLFFLPRQR